MKYPRCVIKDKNLILQEDKSDILETISIMELKGIITNPGGYDKTSATHMAGISTYKILI